MSNLIGSIDRSTHVETTKRSISQLVVKAKEVLGLSHENLAVVLRNGGIKVSARTLIHWQNGRLPHKNSIGFVQMVLESIIKIEQAKEDDMT